jgi:hypothetical protein
VVDNNLFLSGASLLDMSEGGAYAHNLFAGTLVSAPEPNRQMPYHLSHTTTIAGLSSVKGGDCRFFNNIFLNGNGKNSDGCGLATYDGREYPLHTGGNVFCGGAHEYIHETTYVESTIPSNPKLIQTNGFVLLQFSLPPNLPEVKTKLVTTALLGKARVPGLPYEMRNGSPLTIGTDFLGAKRNKTHPAPGPFEDYQSGGVILATPPKL